MIKGPLKLIYSFVFLLVILSFCECSPHVEGMSEETLPDPPPERVKLTTNKGWIFRAVQRHNYYRRMHKAHPLVYNKTLCEMSQSYANYLLEKGVNSLNSAGEVEFFEHNWSIMKEKWVGENLYFLSANYSKINPSLAVNLWYNEISVYDFKRGKPKANLPDDSLYGHLTQLLWASSTQIGIAYASAKLHSGHTLTFVTAYYYPRGNLLVDGEWPEKLFVENVKKQSKDVNSRERKLIREIKDQGIPKATVTTPGGWIAAAAIKHNQYRLRHGLPEVLVSDELCQTAQWWSNEQLKYGLEEVNLDREVTLSRSNPYTHDTEIGENTEFFERQAGEDEVDASTAVVHWYQEKVFYDFHTRSTANVFKTGEITKNFEQILWKSMSHMCMVYAEGTANNGQILTFVTAHYFRSSGDGNKPLGERIKNIPELSSAEHQL